MAPALFPMTGPVDGGGGTDGAADGVLTGTGTVADGVAEGSWLCAAADEAPCRPDPNTPGTTR